MENRAEAYLLAEAHPRGGECPCSIDDGTRLACGCSRCSASTQLDPTRLPSGLVCATGVDNGRTGNQLIDGLLSGRKWEGVITFST